MDFNKHNIKNPVIRTNKKQVRVKINLKLSNTSPQSKASTLLSSFAFFSLETWKLENEKV